MSMQIHDTTTFSQIYQQRTTEGGSLKDIDGGKHLRFKNDNLYTHEGNTHSVGFTGRAKRHHEAVKTIKASIDQELGPGQGDLVFKKLGLSSKKITVDQLERVHGEVERIKDMGHFVPKDVTLRPTETGYQGRVELTWNDEQVTEMRNLLDDIKDAPMSKQGHPVTEQFMTDIHRDTIRLHDGPPKTDNELHYEENNRVLNKNLKELGLSDESPEDDNKGPPKLTKDTAVEKMMTYTGSTHEDSNVCQNLSRFLQQDIWSSMMTRAYLVENESGERLLPTIDQPSIKRSYDVYKDGENYVIDLHWHSGITSLTNDGTLTQRKSETGHTLDMSMRLTIPRDNLKGDPTKPLTSYEILGGPTATLNLNYSENDVVE